MVPYFIPRMDLRRSLCQPVRFWPMWTGCEGTAAKVADQGWSRKNVAKWPANPVCCMFCIFASLVNIQCSNNIYKSIDYRVSYRAIGCWWWVIYLFRSVVQFKPCMLKPGFWNVFFSRQCWFTSKLLIIYWDEIKMTLSVGLRIYHIPFPPMISCFVAN